MGEGGVQSTVIVNYRRIVIREFGLSDIPGIKKKIVVVIGLNSAGEPEPSIDHCAHLRRTARLVSLVSRSRGRMDERTDGVVHRKSSECLRKYAETFAAEIRETVKCRGEARCATKRSRFRLSVAERFDPRFERPPNPRRLNGTRIYCPVAKSEFWQRYTGPAGPRFACSRLLVDEPPHRRVNRDARNVRLTRFD